MYTNILVATDGSKLSAKAVKTACALAKATGAKLTGFYAMPQFPAPIYAEGAAYGNMAGRARYEATVKSHADTVLQDVTKAAAKAGVASDVVAQTSEQPYEAIIKAAKRNRCDLIVMASHGRRGLAGLVLGSETQKVLTHTDTPVLVVR